MNGLYEYLQKLLRDVVGMPPRDAVEYLATSSAHMYFREFRVIFTRPIDPETEVWEPEPYKVGRVTFKLKNDVVAKAWLESPGGRLRHRSVDEDRPRLSVLNPGEVFFLGPPMPLDRIPWRTELLAVRQGPPARGWWIENIEAIHITDEPRLAGTWTPPPEPPPPPPKRRVRPEFFLLSASPP